MRIALSLTALLLALTVPSWRASAETRSDVLAAIATAGAIETVCPMLQGNMRFAALLAAKNGIVLDDDTKRQIYLIVAAIANRSKEVDQKPFCDAAFDGFGPDGALVPGIVTKKE